MKTYPLLTADTLPDAVILADGSYPVNSLPLALLSGSRYVVCCDGAADAFMLAGGNPAAIVGDGDSLSEECRGRFATIIHRVADQETNDLTKAVHFCTGQDKKDLLILGATGKREDHTLGNISLLADYMDRVRVQMVTDYGVFTPVNGDSCFETYSGQQVSIFMTDTRPVTTSGLRYPVQNRILTNWWQGTLNEASGNSFTLQTKGKAIVFRAF